MTGVYTSVLKVITSERKASSDKLVTSFIPPTTEGFFKLDCQYLGITYYSVYIEHIFP